jgi:hypothetical protein
MLDEPRELSELALEYALLVQNPTVLSEPLLSLLHEMMDRFPYDEVTDAIDHARSIRKMLGAS